MPETQAAAKRYSGLLAEGLRMPVTAVSCLLAIAATIYYAVAQDESLLAIDLQGFFVRPWTPITSALAHAGALHLLFNLAWLWKFGAWIESRLGWSRTLALYVGLAVASSAAQYAWRSGGIGLSGVVYGLFGVLWIRGAVDQEAARILDNKSVLVFVVWFFACALLTHMDLFPVANFAHLGGVLAGAAVGWTWNGGGLRRRVSIVGLAVGFVLVLAAATVGRSFTNNGEGFALSYAELGSEAMQRGEYEAALSLCQSAVRCDPTSGFAHWHLGTAQVMTGSEKLGLASLREAARLRVRTDTPERVWIEWMHLRTYQCTTRAEWTTVERLASEIIAIDSSYVDAWTWIGHAAIHAGQPAEACTAFERAFELDPNADTSRGNQVWAKLTRAQMALEAGDIERAQLEAASGLELAPENADLLALKQAIAKQSTSGR